MISTVVDLALVRRMERAYDRAIRAEEAATTERQAWRLASASERALHQLRAARSGLPMPMRRAIPNPARDGLVALALIGRSIGQALTRAASLRKAQAAASIARAYRRAARAGRRALRSTVRAVTRSALHLHHRSHAMIIALAQIVSHPHKDGYGYRILNGTYAGIEFKASDPYRALAAHNEGCDEIGVQFSPDDQFARITTPEWADIFPEEDVCGTCGVVYALAAMTSRGRDGRACFSCAEIATCPGCKRPAHATESDDDGYHPECRPGQTAASLVRGGAVVEVRSTMRVRVEMRPPRAGEVAWCVPVTFTPAQALADVIAAAESEVNTGTPHGYGWLTRDNLPDVDLEPDEDGMPMRNITVIVEDEQRTSGMVVVL